MENQTKKVFCLQGVHDTGKSTTLRNLYEILIEKYDLNTEQDCDIKENGEIDILVVIHNVNGLTIGICSYGDSQADIQSRVPILVKENCDIIFCACHSYGYTVAEVEKLRKKGYEVNFEQKLVVEKKSDRENINYAQAEILLKYASLY